MPRKFQMPKKTNKKQQQTYFKVGVAIPEGTSDKVVDEILDVLARTPFNNVSVPVSTYRYLIEDNIADDDNRVITVGYIKSFDYENQQFNIVIFGNHKQIIEEFPNPALELVFTEYNNKLGVITKFNVVPLEDDENVANVNESAAAAEVVESNGVEE